MIFDPFARTDALNFDLHTHTTYSDGKVPIEDLILYGDALELDALAVTDHVFPDKAGFLDEYVAKVAEGRKRVRSLLLCGVEGTILDLSGRTSVDAAVRAKVDLCLVDVGHMTEGVYRNPPDSAAKQIANVVTAMRNVCENPAVDIVAHPFNLGRINPPLMLDSISLADYRKVARAFADHGKYFEVMNNMWWWFPAVAPRHFRERYLDVIRIFRDEGVRFSIGSDSHSVGGTGNIAWSQGMLREAGVSPEQLIKPRDFLKSAAIA